MLRNTPFHLVDNSPWPLLGGLGIFIIVSSFLFIFQSNSSWIPFAVVFLIILSFFWWRDVVRESTYLSFHNNLVQNNLSTGIIWFITSEVLFFFGFFWAFFHSSLGVSVDLFMIWPPVGVEVLNPLSVPLLNTVVLLSSSITVTWSHYSVFNENLNESLFALLFTISLSVIFTGLQYMEYNESFFMISDSVYGSVFFMATGFHGFHVLVSSAFLFVSLVRMINGHFNNDHHIGFECSIWYWHFVDVVWIFLYLSIYWWGSM